MSVYKGEMTKMRISDQDLERLVHGNEPENQKLAPLAEALQNWQADFARTPTEEQITAFASQAAEIARQTKPEVVPQTSTAPAGFRALKYKLATGMAAVLMVSGISGVAVASDGAAPGDALYGLDRAFESIGINNGGAGERISEAQALFDAGLVGEALEHAAEAFEDDEAGAEAVTALRDAAERLSQNGNGVDTLSSVADMLEWMAGANRGPEFGMTVSEWAKGINGTTPENAGPPSELPNQSNGDPQGNNSENSGEPGRGSQGNQGSQGNGSPQGPPDGAPGQSDNANGGRP